MTIRSRFKVGGSSRSVGSFHYVRASSEVLGSVAVGVKVGSRMLNTVIFLAMTCSIVERCGWVG
jgi:hypothetical protein